MPRAFLRIVQNLARTAAHQLADDIGGRAGALTHIKITRYIHNTQILVGLDYILLFFVLFCRADPVSGGGGNAAGEKLVAGGGIFF